LSGVFCAFSLRLALIRYSFGVEGWFLTVQIGYRGCCPVVLNILRKEKYAEHKEPKGRFFRIGFV
jgi:hypothetical protein